jgi:hypothetical protein
MTAIMNVPRGQIIISKHYSSIRGAIIWRSKIIDSSVKAGKVNSSGASYNSRK